METGQHDLQKYLEMNALLSECLLIAGWKEERIAV